MSEQDDQADLIEAADARREADMKKVLLVGEQNPYGGDEEFALYPSPDGSAGERLCRLILGRTRARYLEEFDRRNLIRRGGKWSAPEARREAAAILASGRRRVVALGARVGAAFAAAAGIDPLRMGRAAAGTAQIVFIPHPSGRNRMWNDPAVAAGARHLVDSLGKQEA